jgi:hypothetical protein
VEFQKLQSYFNNQLKQHQEDTAKKGDQAPETPADLNVKEPPKLVTNAKDLVAILKDEYHNIIEPLLEGQIQTRSLFGLTVNEARKWILGDDSNGVTNDEKAYIEFRLKQFAQKEEERKSKLDPKEAFEMFMSDDPVTPVQAVQAVPDR